MKKVLIANRGEIACRIIRACHKLGLATVAVYSDADEKSRHVALADQAVHIGPSKPSESYLKADLILEIAQEINADAIHPGYGFLAENDKFAEDIVAAGLKWVGPSPETIRKMGDKDRARAIASTANVPILPGSGRFETGKLAGLKEAARAVGYPLLVKASAGGGGIGMRLVKTEDQLEETASNTQALAERSFGDGTIFLERYVSRARHIEIQVFGFGDGRAVHFFDRECSIQRRFQKIIEEAPAPNLPEETRQKMALAAVKLAESENYSGAGTIEFILDATTNEFFFLEMNTRIQVEHPVTEEITGADLVALQLELVGGVDLSHLTQDKIIKTGHAIECRLYAENPDRMFLPSPGKINRLSFPDATGNHLRIETGIRENDTITPYYDPMIAKIISYGNTRAAALKYVKVALIETELEGIATNLNFLGYCIDHEEFQKGNIHTGFIEDYKNDLINVDSKN